MKKLREFFSIIVLDIVGVALIITAALIGWLPGPGGIPLAIAGLTLLAINHEWAERWLIRFKKKGIEIKNNLFKKNK